VTGSQPRAVGISGEVIRLGQLLKLADLVETGAEGKDAIAEGEVAVNGVLETRRGRQLRLGDVIERRGRPPVVVSTEGDVEVPW
jgi:ribosome-associated protein